MRNYNGYVNHAAIRHLKSRGINAEGKKVENSSCSTTMRQNMAKEILQLCEEIVKKRRETNPEDFLCSLFPNDDELSLSNKEVYVNIICDKRFFQSPLAYSCIAITMEEFHIVCFRYQYDGTVTFGTKYTFETELDAYISSDTLKAIHKFLIEMAELEGIDFVSKIKY